MRNRRHWRVLADMPSVDRVLCAGDAVRNTSSVRKLSNSYNTSTPNAFRAIHEMVLFSGRNAAYLKKCQAEFASELLDVLATAPISLELEVAGTPLDGPRESLEAI